MAKITIKEDCGNSPKKQLLKDFNIAFAENNTAFILDTIAEDLVWEMVGEQIIHGKKEAEEMLKSMVDTTLTELTVENIITHGSSGAANGTITFNTGKKYGFCDVYTFTSHSTDAKIKTMKSYIVEIKK